MMGESGRGNCGVCFWKHDAGDFDSDVGDELSNLGDPLVWEVPGEFLTFSRNAKRLFLILSPSRSGLGDCLRSGTGLELGLGLEVATVECSNGEWTRVSSWVMGLLGLSSPPKEKGSFPLMKLDSVWDKFGLPEEWLRLSGTSVTKLIGWTVGVLLGSDG